MKQYACCDRRENFNDASVRENTPQEASRHFMFSTEYNITIDIAGSTDAYVVSINVLMYSTVSCE
jgi:hypothetical protein